MTGIENGLRVSTSRARTIGSDERTRPPGRKLGYIATLGINKLQEKCIFNEGDI